MKSLVAGLFAFVAAAAALPAANVSFLVIDAGESRDAAAGRLAAAWENGLLEFFFESGRIVSTAPMMRLDEAPGPGLPPEAERDLEDARIGGMDYFLIAVVDRRSRDVSLRLFRVSSGGQIAERANAGDPERCAREEGENIRRAAGEMAALLR